jgi:hypothetical protein
MRVAWLADPGNADGSIGGAEMTQQEFRDAAPEGVETVTVSPDEVLTTDKLTTCDVACVFNCVFYPEGLIRALSGKRVVRYWNDVAPHGSPKLTLWLLGNATNVFCSPLHHERFPWRNGKKYEFELIPPPVNLEPFRDAAESAQERSGAVSVAAWMNLGKAPHLAAEWAVGNGGLDFYGGGPFAPASSRPVGYDAMPSLLARYETFVFLPSALEPFCRLVVEADAAGCKVITNRLVGARYWLEKAPDKLESAADDFWKLVTR